MALTLTLLASAAQAINQVTLDFDRKAAQIALIDDLGFPVVDETGSPLEQSLSPTGFRLRNCSSVSSGDNLLSISSGGGENVCLLPRLKAIGLGGSFSRGEIAVGQSLKIAPGNEDQEFVAAELTVRVTRFHGKVEVIASNGETQKVIEVRVGRFQTDEVPETVDAVVLCRPYRSCDVSIAFEDGERFNHISLAPTAGRVSLTTSTFDVLGFEPVNPVLDLACGDNDIDPIVSGDAELTITREDQAGDSGCTDVPELPLDLGVVDEVIDGVPTQTFFFQTDNEDTNPVFFLGVTWRAEIIDLVDQAAIEAGSSLPTNTGQIRFSIQGHNALSAEFEPEIFLVDQCPQGTVQLDGLEPVGFDPSGLGGPNGPFDMSSLKDTLDFGCYYRQEVERVADAVCNDLYDPGVQPGEACVVVRQGVAVIGDWFTSRKAR